MERNIFKININNETLNRLREKINEYQNISYNKTYGKYRAWDKICAILDRLDDTADYLNQLKLNTGKHTNSAFDFFDFMNNAAVVLDCINHLAKVFEVSCEEINTSTSIFNKLGNDGKGTDKKYFEYLRSLCSVHPIDTNRHKRYQDNDFECSPFVVWNNINMYMDDSDIYAVVYTSKDGEHSKRIPIYISQIFSYVYTRIDFIEKIIIHIDKYQKQVIEGFISKEIKKEDEFDSYIDYLKNLKSEAENRFGNDNLYSFDYIIKLFKLKVSNTSNKDTMNLYKNALKYAIKFAHNSIQNVSYNEFENTGLLYNTKKLETSLLDELSYLNSHSLERKKYIYNLEKIGYLSYDTSNSDKAWAYIQLNKMLPFLERYVSFEGAESDFEHYALVKLSLYLECLENDCLVNKNIPYDKKYRIM